MANNNRYKEELKKFKQDKRKARLSSIPHKLGLHFHWYKDMQMKSIIKQNLLPDTSSITKHVAFVINDEVVEIMHCQENLANILLSTPTMLELSSDSTVKVGSKYKDGKFTE
jgi:hypothetical protein